MHTHNHLQPGQLRSSQLTRIIWITLFLNISVCVVKIVVGFLSGAMVIVADGLHSLSDAASNIVGLIGIKIASKPADHNHPYGHEKYETLAAIVIAVFLFITCYGIIREALVSFFEPKVPNITPIVFACMIGTLMVNILVAVYEGIWAKRLKSDFLASDAWHTLTDVFVTVGVLLALIGIKAGIPHLDGIFSLAIAGLIVWVGVGILKESSDVLCDTAVLDAQAIKTLVMVEPLIKDCHEIRTRGRKDSVYVDLHILVDEKMSVAQSHGLSHVIEDKIKLAYPTVRDVVVHVEPNDDHKH